MLFISLHTRGQYPATQKARQGPFMRGPCRFWWVVWTVLIANIGRFVLESTWFYRTTIRGSISINPNSTDFGDKDKLQSVIAALSAFHPTSICRPRRIQRNFNAWYVMPSLGRVRFYGIARTYTFIFPRVFLPICIAIYANGWLKLSSQVGGSNPIMMNT